MIEQEWVPMRRKFLGDFQKQDFSSLAPKIRSELLKAEGIIRQKLTPDTMSGAMKENRGVIIPKPDGTPHQHGQTKLPQSWRALANRLEFLKLELNIANQNGNVKSAKILQQNLSSLSKLLDKSEILIERSQCLAKVEPKLKP